MRGKGEEKKKSIKTPPHLCQQLGFMCVYTGVSVDRGHSYNPGQQKQSKGCVCVCEMMGCSRTWRYQGRQTASLMSANSRALQQQPAADNLLPALQKIKK